MRIIIKHILKKRGGKEIDLINPSRNGDQRIVVVTTVIDIRVP
jgi:hypothetical protein